MANTPKGHSFPTVANSLHHLGLSGGPIGMRGGVVQLLPLIMRRGNDLPLVGGTVTLPTA